MIFLTWVHACKTSDRAGEYHAVCLDNLKYRFLLGKQDVVIGNFDQLLNAGNYYTYVY